MKTMVVLGAVYVDAMVVQYDPSGATLLTFSDGQKLAFFPAYSDLSLLVQAQACGYGRQVGLMQFHTVLMHCLIASNEGTDPEWLRAGAPDADRIQQAMYMTLMLNNQRTGAEPDPEHETLVEAARYILRGDFYGGDSGLLA